MANLRKLQQEDLDLILKWRNKDFIRLNMHKHQIIEKQEHLNWFKKTSKENKSSAFIYEENHQSLAYVNFKLDELENKKIASWGFYLLSDEGKGIATKMALLAIPYAFDFLNIKKIFAEVLSFNTKSLAYHKKLGFKLKNIQKKSYQRNQVFYDIYHFELTKKDWLTNGLV